MVLDTEGAAWGHVRTQHRHCHLHRNYKVMLVLWSDTPRVTLKLTLNTDTPTQERQDHMRPLLQMGTSSHGYGHCPCHVKQPAKCMTLTQSGKSSVLSWPDI